MPLYLLLAPTLTALSQIGLLTSPDDHHLFPRWVSVALLVACVALAVFVLVQRALVRRNRRRGS